MQSDQRPDRFSLLLRPIEYAGERAIRAAEVCFETVEFIACVVGALLLGPFRGRFPPLGTVIYQSWTIGFRAAPIVSLIGFLIGGIMAFFAADQLRRFSANSLVADLVAISMVRELGPLMTAIVVAGRSGSAIAAELGSMVAGEEIDALRAMGLDPIRFLVIPRIYAISLVLPMLSAIAMCCGIVGGLLSGHYYLDLGIISYFEKTRAALLPSDLATGLLKSVVFALVVVIVSCRFGLSVKRGIANIGPAATSAVVLSILLVIVVDGLFALVSASLGDPF